MNAVKPAFESEYAAGKKALDQPIQMELEQNRYRAVLYSVYRRLGASTAPDDGYAPYRVQTARQGRLAA